MNKVLGTSLTPWDLEKDLTEEWYYRIAAYLSKVKEVADER